MFQLTFGPLGPLGPPSHLILPVSPVIPVHACYHTGSHTSSCSCRGTVSCWRGAGRMNCCTVFCQAVVSFQYVLEPDKRGRRFGVSADQ